MGEHSMKEYKISASYMVYCSLIIEAKNEDEAREMAYELDGGDFDSDEEGDWNIDNVIELKKEKEKCI
jgi:hypothetical protein